MKMIAENATLECMCTKFGVSFGTITNIKNGRAWKQSIVLLEPDIKEKFLQIQLAVINRKLLNKEK